MTRKSEVTQVLNDIRDGDANGSSRLFQLVYDELRSIAHHHLRNDPARELLQTTAVVHEAYLKLVDPARIAWQGRAHFYRTAARAIRRVLVDQARRQSTVKREPEGCRIALVDSLAFHNGTPVDILDLHHALEKLSEAHPRLATVVELRYFAGLNQRETAEVLDTTAKRVAGDFEFARAWLFQELGRG
jgi:RNA polymerase sigma factor (TIGR02999 family)